MPSPGKVRQIQSESVAKYLRKWAERESLAISARLGAYHSALIVPVLGESVDLLDGFREAANQVDGRVLAILVVNSADETPQQLREMNRRLLTFMATRGRHLARGATLITEPEFDVLVIDCASDGRELPIKQGVGLARKIGGDIALGLYAQGRLKVPVLYFTDADAELPGDYFQRAGINPDDNVSAWLFPFCHIAGPDDKVNQATQLYELSIRYHVLGLAYAASPYAYHSVGSTLAVAAHAYAAVRGVPKRNAGEDFYLLDKLGKVSPICRLSGPPIRLQSRCSERVPFGTGPRVAIIVDQGDVWVASPTAYDVLRLVIAALNRFAIAGDAVEFERLIDELPAPHALAAQRAMMNCDLLNAVTDAATKTSLGNLHRRVHGWFDALRTLRFLHALRDAGISDVGWQAAMQSAPFIKFRGTLDCFTVVAHLVELESQLAAQTGANTGQ